MSTKDKKDSLSSPQLLIKEHFKGGAENNNIDRTVNNEEIQIDEVQNESLPANCHLLRYYVLQLCSYTETFSPCIGSYSQRLGTC